MAVQSSRIPTFPSFAQGQLLQDVYCQQQHSRVSSALVADKVQVNDVLQLPHVAEVLDRQNVGFLSALLRNTDILPERYVIPECHRSQLSHDAFAEAELPVIDFSRLASTSPEELKVLVREVGSACKDWGFFQIVNHGVPQQLINEMQSQAKRFFELPYQRKEKAAIFPRPLGYNGRYKDMSSSAPWIEVLAMQQTPVSTVDETIEKVWPEDKASFRKTIWTYHAEMEKLGKNVVELLTMSLSLERRTLSQHFQRTSTTVRWNHYPPCPIPSQALGLHAHSDPSALTILQQDTVGGLQIKKDGRWIAVKPRPNAFIVNIGDLLQAWTNGRYKSVEHRAVVNRDQERLSMVFFYGPQPNVVIRPPSELINDEEQLRYRPFTWGEYEASRLSIAGQGKAHLDVFAGVVSRG